MELKDAAKAHIEAYNALFDEHVLENIVANIPALVVGRAKVMIEDVHIHKPFLSDKEHISIDRRLFPWECRERNLTYRGRVTVKMSLFYDNKHVASEDRSAGFFPIMVRSKLCHLNGVSDLNAVGEDDSELGGYFIVNGIDKVVRFHVVQKRNHAFAVCRQRRDASFTNHMVSMRSVGRDEIGQINNIHYCANGNMVLRIFYRRSEYFLPLILVLKALVNTTDEELFDALGRDQRIIYLLKNFAEHNTFSRNECLDYIGSKFKVILGVDDKVEAGKEVLRRCVAVHLSSDLDKFNFLILATRKLLSFVSNEIVVDNVDVPSNHELLTETQIISVLLRDRLEDVLRTFLVSYRKAASKRSREKDGKRSLGSEGDVSLGDPDEDHVLGLTAVKEIFKKMDVNVGHRLEHFLSTGNLNALCCSDILQSSGFCIVAERVNFYRYLSHFRSISRGSFFAAMKTTEVRKLRPESWGFICPVHTPDGAPCGLLTHLSSGAAIVNSTEDFDPGVLFEFGVVPVVRGVEMKVPVVVDGRVTGFTSSPSSVVDMLRRYRNSKGLQIEIVHLYGPKLFPSVLIFSTIGRFARRVINMRLGREEWIGIMEQVSLNIRLEGKGGGVGSMCEEYCEIDDVGMLSIVAGLTPYSDYNQSPRNMYQCQMAKQAMGLPSHNIRTRTDVRLYTINYTQSPMVRTQGYEMVKEYPMGVNCMVAVLAYTAYDMEDAVVVNKSSMERGLFTGYVYKNEKVSLGKDCYFTYLPFTGQGIGDGDVLYKYIDDDGREYTERYHSSDSGTIDTIRVFHDGATRCATFTIRMVRNPNIGDKFCSRHGQKGVCSMHWPLVDMPFTESGYVPDIIINPHAFPSRMTIGMLLESMAGKAGCLCGKAQDGTPFRKRTFLDSGDVAGKEGSIGDELRRHGFNYYGNEPMYSGVSGNELRVDVFVGVVFYQRLRHMVNDKFQVRTGGAVVSTTGQPVGGRKRQGGIRFGEMERDALIAHGSSYMLQDRLFRSSDATRFEYCGDCRSILFTNNGSCQCGGSDLKVVEMPYVFKYLCSELLAMNIRVKIDL